MVPSLGTVRSAFSAFAVCAVAASCSFPEYGIAPDTNPFERICSDKLISDAETDVDCGGGCPPCAMGKACKTADDCASGSCVDDTCQMPTCSDRVKNAAESDVDCGGPCGPCRAGRDCKVDQDCADGVCEAPEACEGDDCPAPFCQVATCSDRVQNGDETGMDCGGDCSRCGNGMGCAEDGDCQSGHCTGRLCVAPGCTDELLNGDESDVDCGGPECRPCEAEATCNTGADCASRICEGGVCTADGCEDGVMNRDESDVDCGGTACSGCGELEHCATGADCASSVCLTGYCVPKTPTGVALSRDGWHATALESYPDHRPDQVLDSEGGRWTSGTDQHEGMWFEVDMGKLQTFFELRFTSTEQTSDAPGQYRIYLATEAGQYGAPAGPNHFGGPVSVYTFDTARLARFVKIEIAQNKAFWWSINEINVYQ